MLCYDIPFALLICGHGLHVMTQNLQIELLLMLPCLPVAWSDLVILEKHLVCFYNCLHWLV